MKSYYAFFSVTGNHVRGTRQESGNVPRPADARSHVQVNLQIFSLPLNRETFDFPRVRERKLSLSCNSNSTLIRMRKPFSLISFARATLSSRLALLAFRVERSVRTGTLVAQHKRNETYGDVVVLLGAG